MNMSMRVLSVAMVAGVLGCGGGTGSGAGLLGGAGMGGVAGIGGVGLGQTSASCGTVEPCGGDVIGTWKVENTCLVNGGLMMDASDICAGATLDTTGISGMGMMTFAADGTY